ncbi:hypothetical protein PTSG_01490 [Salpingoeca rosetta]|uniref:Replication protein A C-terminal domain-containing protein n=1 Tax=Salpingoeca rosetta (strain ATCC 50818 / BSB-021) TaxID=946362 RepID=F2U0H7_SALR5|nr:uncharacterized protein PTSG_01490 [Salpingoeca rosetta]EGD80905.1 hypothetical protein PTSG_01490 [Salpingoeca rosetta]|eukprot:XP_004997466.1 hypothetical protein PTSG_01490 [Salpingoeca rosetta]
MDGGFGGGGFGDYNTSNGGGFMTGEGGGFSSQSPADAGIKRISTVTPVCVKQVKDAQRGDDTSFIVNGVAVDKVALVAVIRNVQQKATRISYNVEDHTGLIDVMQYLSGGDDEEEPQVPEEVAQNREGRYVRIVASIRAGEDDSKRLNAFLITPIDDHNELTYHFLNVVYANLVSSHGILGERKLGLQAGQPRGSQPSQAGMAGQGMGTATNGATAFNNTPMDTGLPRNLQAVLNVIQTEGSASETGVGMSTILDRLRPQGFNEPQIRSAVEELLNEGQVYSTVDDDHFKSTDD